MLRVHRLSWPGRSYIQVLIEAVENHMPQVIVIDEISTKLEAVAASTIAQRGIQLVATAHGATIENLIMNPSLEILVGGIQSVTLGDEEANRRGVQKSVLERKGPPTFSCAVEIISKTELRVHHCLEATVDAVLLGLFPNVEILKISSQGVEKTTKGEALTVITSDKSDETLVGDVPELDKESTVQDGFPSKFPSTMEVDLVDRMQLLLYTYGGIKQLEMDAAVKLIDNISEADALLALHSKLKKNPRIQAAAKSHGIPIYVTKTSSIVQVTKAIRTLVDDREDKRKDFVSEDKVNFSEKMDALEEARVAIEQVVIPKGEPVELLPRPSPIITLQVDLIQKYQLRSETVGQEPEDRLRILPFQAGIDD
ncbi:uncharacterized protein ycf45-like isoform X3 [Carica papaya]|uniref:uncharacterized protein ycf45-like isoform X3 n=1 Tax=Carica papaya TaxID=3649 RepID=UPI000B8C8113|nr:uncharacterized protein ycf45-like isoform X3 [Carica papaya]